MRPPLVIDHLPLATAHPKHQNFPSQSLTVDFSLFLTSCKRPFDAFFDLYVFARCALCYLEYTRNFSDNMELHMLFLRHYMQYIIFHEEMCLDHFLEKAPCDSILVNDHLGQATTQNVKFEQEPISWIKFKLLQRFFDWNFQRLSSPLTFRPEFTKFPPIAVVAVEGFTLAEQS